MHKNLPLLGMACAVFCAIFGLAQQSTPTIKLVPLKATSPTSGGQMYAAYCAACHDADGRGNGPAAQVLTPHPADLTALARNNGGKFPSLRVVAILQAGVNHPLPNSVNMPAWGYLFTHRAGTENPSVAELETAQRISNLTNYLRTLQQ